MGYDASRSQSKRIVLSILLPFAFCLLLMSLWQYARQFFAFMRWDDFTDADRLMALAIVVKINSGWRQPIKD